MGVIAKSSIDAYQLLQRKGKLSRLEANIFRLIAEQPGHTNREYAKMYFERYPHDKSLPTSIQPRVSDLHRKGYVEPIAMKKCSITAVMARAWGVPEQIQLLLEGME